MIRLVDLYPRMWRSRYEDEFLALLADRPPDLSDRLDIVRGAVDARLHPRPEGSPLPVQPVIARDPWSVRTGWLTLVGGLLWLAAMVVALQGPIGVGAYGSYRDATVAMPLVFLAVILLGAGMLLLVVELPRPARLARATAYVTSLAGLLWAFAPWFIWLGLIAFGGLVIIGISAWRAGRWSLIELSILVVGVAVPWGIVIGVALGAWAPNPNPDVQFLVLGILSAAWVVVGSSLVRLPRVPRNHSVPGPHPE